MPFQSRLSKLPFAAVAAVLALAILLTRLPFLGTGYGAHADNWRVALAARHIAETGAYEASRFPGYPVQEYVCSWFWKTGPFGLNALDTFFCITAAIMFGLICREYGCRDGWLAALAFAFVPVVYVNSVSSKDFLWAAAFLLGAWWCAMRQWPFRTGLLLGLAMGCRITSGAAALPIALLLVDGLPNRRALLSVLTAGLVAACVCAAAFAPDYWRYGWDFVDFYADHAFPSPLMIFHRATVEVWGWLGAAGILLALLGGLRRGAERPKVSRRHLLAWALMIVLYLFAFLSLPDEAAYLIPIIPFLFLFAWYAAPPVLFRIACTLVLVSPWVGFNGSGQPTVGDVVADHRQRIEDTEQVKILLDLTSKVPGRNAYIVGSWEPAIAVLTADHPPASKYLYLVTKPQLEQLVAQGWHVWYFPLMREFDARVYKFDIARYGARSAQELGFGSP